MGKILLIGVTGGTGIRVVRGFLEQKQTELRAITRHLDKKRFSLSQLTTAGVEIVEADLDDESTLEKAFIGVSAVYCHATSGDYSQAAPREVERAKTLAVVAKKAQIKHLVYNSAGGAERKSRIKHIQQKYEVEKVFREAGLPTTMLRACLFMEEFWKKYTRPSILKGRFPFSLPSSQPIHLLCVKDLGRVAAWVMTHREKYLKREIELAGDILTPQQIAREFQRCQRKTVVHQEIPAWLFLLVFRWQLFKLIQWYRHEGYQANVQHLRREFPNLLTSFQEFLQETQWADKTRTYESLQSLSFENQSISKKT